MTTDGHHQIDHLADGGQVLDVLALELDAKLVLDDLGDLHEVKRIDIELLEARLPRDLPLGADLLQAVEDDLLDTLGCGLCWHLRVSFRLSSSFRVRRSGRRRPSGSCP